MATPCRIGTVPSVQAHSSSSRCYWHLYDSAENADDSRMFTNVLKNFKTYYFLAGAVAGIALLMLKSRPVMMMALFSLASLLCAVGVILRYFKNIQGLWMKIYGKGIIV